MDKFRELVAVLRDRLPPVLPVRVYLRDVVEDDAYGLCWLARKNSKPSHFVIVIRRFAAWAVIKDTLLHEWAHAIAWSEAHDTVEDHGPEWGLAMSRVYQEAVEP